MDLTHPFRDCACPGTPHQDGDIVTYRPKLSFDAAARAVGAIWGTEGEPSAQKGFDIYLHDGPLSWNLVDGEGNAVPLNDDALDALDFADQYEIADYGDTLYRDTVISPLQRRTKSSSKSGPTSAGSRRPSKP